MFGKAIELSFPASPETLSPEFDSAPVHRAGAFSDVRKEDISEVKVLVAQSCPALCDPWTVAGQVPLTMEFSRQESWSG